MTDPAKSLNRLDPSDGILGSEMPPRFAEALEQVRTIIAHCEAAKIPNDTLLAALMAELMPRLVGTYGPAGVASVFGRLAGAIADVGKPFLATQ